MCPGNLLITTRRGTFADMCPGGSCPTGCAGSRAELSLGGRPQPRLVIESPPAPPDGGQERNGTCTGDSLGVREYFLFAVEELTCLPRCKGVRMVSGTLSGQSARTTPAGRAESGLHWSGRGTALLLWNPDARSAAHLSGNDWRGARGAADFRGRERAVAEEAGRRTGTALGESSKYPPCPESVGGTIAAERDFAPVRAETIPDLGRLQLCRTKPAATATRP